MSEVELNVSGKRDKCVAKRDSTSWRNCDCLTKLRTVGRHGVYAAASSVGMHVSSHII